jgi:hypothetical protein
MFSPQIKILKYVPQLLFLTFYFQQYFFYIFDEFCITQSDMNTPVTKYEYLPYWLDMNIVHFIFFE